MPFSYERARKELLEEQAKLKKQFQQLESGKYEGVGHGNHMADDGTEAFEQAVDVALRRKINASLKKVERALTKFKDGTYGICETCGGRIDRARLEALPQATHCMDCQAQHEHGRKRVVAR